MNPNKKTHFSPAIYILLAFLLSLVACTSGCQVQTDSKLVGTWEIAEVDSVLEQVNQNSSASDEDSETSNGSPPQMTITFKANGVLETATQLGQLNIKKSGTWQVTSKQGPTTELTDLKIGCELADQTTEHDVEWIDENSIRLAPPNMAGVNQTFRFHRK